MKKWFGLCALLLLFGCKKPDRFAVPGKATHLITIQRFDQTFFNTGTSPDSLFLNLYGNQIMEVGQPGSSSFREFESIFRTDSEMLQLYQDCQKTFKDVSGIEQKLSLAFYRLHHFYPNLAYPKVYMHISGFGESMVSAPGILSASIDKYLGSDYPMYKDRFYPYQTQRMKPDRLVADYMAGWIRSEFTPETLLKDQRLLDYLVYEGKIWFLLRILLPDENMEALGGFSKDQLNWCMQNEKNMWEALLQLQHLYSTDPLVLSKYLGEAPNTSFFPKTSPGRAITWTGYRMVKKYMEKKSDASLQDLFQTDAKNILSESLYKP